MARVYPAQAPPPSLITMGSFNVTIEAESVHLQVRPIGAGAANRWTVRSCAPCEVTGKL